MPEGRHLLAFRCTGCGNCCRDPLLPLTDDDLRRLVAEAGADWRKLVKWVSRDDIALNDRRWFVELRQGPRALVLRHRRGRCVYLGPDDRCTAYDSRPLGCRVFPLDAEFTARGALQRLELIPATDCPYSLDGRHRVADLRTLQRAYDTANDAYIQLVADWNRSQRSRKRRGKQAQTARQFMEFIGF